MLKWLASSPAAGALKLNAADQSLTPEGDLIKEPNAVARALAKSLSPTLTGGSSPVEQAQVIQWQSWSTTEGQDVFAKAVELNAFLESRSFLVGTSPTLADISVYFALAPGVQLSFPGPLGGLTHLMRWFDQIQNVLRSGQAFFKGHDVGLLPKVVPLHSIYKPLVMPVFGRLAGVGGTGAGKPGSSAAGGAGKSGGAGAGGKENAAAAGGGAGANGKGKGGGGGGGGEQQPPAQGKKKEKGGDKKPAAATAAAPAAAVAEQPDNPNALDIRVGKMVKVWKHPDAEKLYCEEIDVGEEGGPRQIASGLRQFYADESELEGRMVLVLANLKPRALVGFKSNGMVLCASNAEHTEVKLVEPPASAKVGDRIVFGSYPVGEGLPLNPNQLQKKKVFEKLAPDLVTDSKGVCMWKEAPFLIAGGDAAERCTAPLPNAHVS